MKKLLLISICLISFGVQAQNMEESTAGLYGVLPQEDLLGFGLGSSWRPQWEINDNLFVGANAGAEIYFIDNPTDEFGNVDYLYDDQITFLGLGPSARYYLFEYLYAGVDTTYFFGISEGVEGGIRVMPSVGYSFERFNLEIGYQYSAAGPVDIAGLAIGFYYKF